MLPVSACTGQKFVIPTCADIIISSFAQIQVKRICSAYNCPQDDAVAL